MKVPPRLGAALSVLQLLLCASGSAAELTSSELTSPVNGTSQQAAIVRDCSDLPYGSLTGVYLIQPDLVTPTPAYCDLDDGEGWTVFQRRSDILPRCDFYRDWEDYKRGLGSFYGEFWWGLHHLWQLTSQLDRVYELRVDLWDWEGRTRYATYQKFTIASEAHGYRLDFVDYAGDAGDSLAYHNGMKFSTFDRDQDTWSGTNCATDRQGAWWYNACSQSNLNGLYLPGISNKTVVTWDSWRSKYSLNATTMKIRPIKKV